MADALVTDFVVIDCETTFSAAYGHIPIELGAVAYCGAEKESCFSSLVNPGVSVAPIITEITGITNEDTASVPELEDVLPAFLAFVGDRMPIVGHNVRFDVTAICNACKMIGIKPPYWEDRIIDTMGMANDLFRHTSLENCARWLGVQVCGQHRAEEDCCTTALVYLALQKELCRCETKKKKKSCQYGGGSAIGTRISIDSEGRIAMERMGRSPDKERLSPYERHQKRVQDIIDEAKAQGVCFDDIHFAFHGYLTDPEIMRTGGLDLIVEALGGVYHKKASGKVDYYVCFDDEETGTVLEARQIAADPRYHMRIIETEEFLELLGYGGREVNVDDPALIRTRKANERQQAIDRAQEEEEKKAARMAMRAERSEAKAAKPEKPLGRHVQQLDHGGNVVKEYETVAMAAAEMGISTKVIRDAANGKQRTAGGYCWRYID